MTKNRFSSGIRLHAGVIASVAFALALAGCASKTPAPVVGRNGQPTSQQAADSYTVKAGDTLYSIAREHGMDHRELIALNGIENPNQISVGRILKIRPPSTTVSGSEATVVTPVSSDTVTVQPIGEAPAVGQASSSAGGADQLKRGPKAGKEPYSEQALAAAQGQGASRVVETPVAKPEPKPEDKPATAVAGADDVPWIWPSSGKLISTYSENGSKGVDIAGKTGDPVVAAGDGKVVYSGTGLRGYGKLVIVKHNATYLSAYAHNSIILVKEGQSVSRGQKIAEMGNSDADQVKLHFEVRRQGKPVDPMKYLPPR